MRSRVVGFSFIRNLELVVFCGSDGDSFCGNLLGYVPKEQREMKTTFAQTARKTIESNVIKDDAKRKQLTERVNRYINKSKQFPQSQQTVTKFSASVGAEVKALRESLGLNVRDFSKAVGMAYPNVCYIEQGKATCSMKTLNRIAEAHGKTIEIKFI